MITLTSALDTSFFLFLCYNSKMLLKCFPFYIRNSSRKLVLWVELKSRVCLASSNRQIPLTLATSSLIHQQKARGDVFSHIWVLLRLFVLNLQMLSYAFSNTISELRDWWRGERQRISGQEYDHLYGYSINWDDKCASFFTIAHGGIKVERLYKSFRQYSIRK